MAIPISQFTPTPAFPLVTMFVFYICDSICFVNNFICTIFLDSTYKWYYMIFVLARESNLKKTLKWKIWEW